MAAFHRAERRRRRLPSTCSAPGRRAPGRCRSRLGSGCTPAKPSPDDGDYHAPAVNRAARVAGAAHGGPGPPLRRHRDAPDRPHARRSTSASTTSRGLPPMRISTRCVADGPARRTSRRSHDAGQRRGHPRLAAATSFVGRQTDVATRRRSSLATHRLVTLTGAGGSGKTRLAIEVAAAPDPDRVVFVDLAPVADDDGVAIGGRRRPGPLRTARRRRRRRASPTYLTATPWSCACSTTASTSWTAWPHSPAPCCSEAASRGSSSPAASRSASSVSRCSRWLRSTSDTAAVAALRRSGPRGTADLRARRHQP